jgi:hypothetical protein
MRIAKRTCMMNAIVAVARKLASILHRILLDGAEYHAGNTFGNLTGDVDAVERKFGNGGTITICHPPS